MLPTKDELERMLQENKLEKQRLGAIKACQEREEQVKKQQEQEKQFAKEIREKVKYVEECILGAIKDAKRSVELEYGDGHTVNPVWESAITQLKHNKDYKFSIDSVMIRCDNYMEACNVDYVTGREWSEGRWRLTVTW